MFDSSEHAELPLAARRLACVHVVRGKALINGQRVGGGDALLYRDETAVRIEHGDGAELLVFDLKRLRSRWARLFSRQDADEQMRAEVLAGNADRICCLARSHVRCTSKRTTKTPYTCPSTDPLQHERKGSMRGPQESALLKSDSNRQLRELTHEAIASSKTGIRHPKHAPKESVVRG